MKEKEAINGLNNLFSEHELTLPHTDSLEILHMAVDALEKQIPKEVKNRKLLRDFYKTPYAIRGDCPTCGSIGLLSSNTDYCNACGQKLKWDSNNLKD